MTLLVDAMGVPTGTDGGTLTVDGLRPGIGRPEHTWSPAVEPLTSLRVGAFLPS